METPSQLQSIVSVLSRCAAIYVLLAALRTGLNSVAIAERTGSDVWHWLALISVAILLIVALALWRLHAGVARIVVPRHLADAVPSRIDHAALERTVISMLGLYLVAATLPEVLTHLSWAASEASSGSAVWYGVLKASLTLVIGILLMFKASGIRYVIDRVRRAGA